MVTTSTKEKVKQTSSTRKSKSVSDAEINAKYEKGEQRILTEMNREKLPNFAESLNKKGYIETRPFYQRRDRWDNKKQSQLIESFLINIPVPPIILYEEKLNSYEVMDGQQRITAIQKFYNNQLKLTGLEIWEELNGRTYDTLPDKIQAGIDRRSISSIVLIAESTSDPEEALFIKQTAFERLNTGGVKLSPQEIRNCLYSGEFNQVLFELSKNPIFKNAWEIPLNDEAKLKNNNLYKKMEDVELILRFFALRERESLPGNLTKALDMYMIQSLEFSSQEISKLKNLFLHTIELAGKIYGEHLFKPYDYKTNTWKDRAYKACYDAVMVGLSEFPGRNQLLLENKERVLEETKELFKTTKSNLFTGSGKTKSEIRERIQIFKDLLERAIS